MVQLTPPGSACSVSFGTGIEQGLELVVDTARTELTKHGIEVSEVFHRDGAKIVPGPAPNHQSYNSYASFKDPEGNGWLLQEVTTRLPGRNTSPLAAYGSVDNLADALRRAAEAHGRHEQQIGHADKDWPAWYAQYMADESAEPNTGKSGLMGEFAARRGRAAKVLPASRPIVTIQRRNRDQHSSPRVHAA